MNIEDLEILKELSEQTYFGDLPFLYYADLIGKLLTAYEKEKEEHKKECHNCDEYTARLGELETKNRMLKSELEKEKEKEKNLLIQLKDSEKELLEVCEKLRNSVSKDKIRKMLQELEDRRNKQPVIGYWSKKAMLEKLLKEE